MGGKTITELNLFDWAIEAEKRGAGEILFTSMNNDGTKDGYANKALLRLSKLINIPIIASGGAGEIYHFIDVFKQGKADAALAASVFHYNEISINELKKKLKAEKINVRFLILNNKKERANKEKTYINFIWYVDVSFSCSSTCTNSSIL